MNSDEAILHTLEYLVLYPEDPVSYAMVSDGGRTAAGIDASRRVAWAKYYRALQDNEILLKHNRTLLRHLARFAIAVSRAEAVQLFEPDLVEEAKRVLMTLSMRAAGQAIIEDLLDDDR